MSKSLQMATNISILISLVLSLVFRQHEFLIAVGLISTIPVILSAILALKNKKVSIDLLASIALFVSILNHEWVSVAFINLMITSARIFGDYTEARADNAIKNLLKLRPEIVKIKNGNQIISLPIEKVKIGDIVIVETGDRIPVDGKIIEGTGNIDESSLTGESLPVTKTIGQKVFSSTLNLSGSIIIKTEKVGTDTTFEKILTLVQNAEVEKQGITGIADKFSTIYIIATLSVSIIIFAITKNTNLILSVLLVACADDIAVAIPIGLWGGITKAAKNGIIIKGSQYLEGLSDLQTIIFDKTGTLTKGNIKTQKIICFNNTKSSEALSLLANIESVSEHPIAKAIVLHAKNDGLKINSPEKFEEIAGFGIKTFKGKSKIVVGNLKFLINEKVKITKAEKEEAESYQKNGFQIVFLGINNKLGAILTLADEVRPEARQAIANLRNLGIKNIIMLTGDNELVASRVAKSVGISEFHASLLPEDKLNFIKNIINKNKGKVAMVGDGVNDAASLKLADIGIAMGAIGADSAIESADIALMKDNLSKLITAIRISRFTKKVSKQNFFIWGALDVLGLSLVFTSLIGPVGAAAFNFVTDFFPILNALRVFKYKIN
ncbi:heavy metal translocating P-type ATPase [soil metagenome]